MTETVVHVTTLDQWKSVLDVWFAQGYEWFSSKGYREDYFRNGSRQLRLNHINKISYYGSNLYSEDDCIEYADFMSQQEKTMAKETYYVTQEQLDLIEYLKDEAYPLLALAMNTFAYDSDFEEKFDPNVLFTDEFVGDSTVALTKYLAGDTSIEFKVKEQLYRLWRIDDENEKVYMWFELGTPSYIQDKSYAFTAPREEIEKHKTVSWEIEKAD